MTTHLRGGVSRSAARFVSLQGLQTNSAFVAGFTLSLLTISLAVTAVALGNLRPRQSIIIGGLVAAMSLGLLLLSASPGSLTIFLLTGIVSGASYGLSFGGGLRLINHAAPAEHRSGPLAALYLAAYASQGVIAVLAGLFTTAHGLRSALDLFVPILAAAALISSPLGMLRPATPVTGTRGQSDEKSRATS